MTVVGDAQIEIRGFGKFVIPPGSEKEPAIAVQVTDDWGVTSPAVLFYTGEKYIPTHNSEWNSMVAQAKGDIKINPIEGGLEVIIQVPLGTFYRSEVIYGPDGTIYTHPFRFFRGEPGH